MSLSDKEFDNLARRRQRHHRWDQIERYIEDRELGYCENCSQLHDAAESCSSGCPRCDDPENTTPHSEHLS